VGLFWLVIGLLYIYIEFNKLSQYRTNIDMPNIDIFFVVNILKERFCSAI